VRLAKTPRLDKIPVMIRTGLREKTITGTVHGAENQKEQSAWGVKLWGALEGIVDNNGRKSGGLSNKKDENRGSSGAQNSRARPASERSKEMGRSKKSRQRGGRNIVNDLRCSSYPGDNRYAK